MRNRRSLLILLLATFVLLFVANLARQRVTARPLVDSHNVVFQQTYAFGGVVPDDLVVWAQTIRLDSGSRVDGDAALIGSDVSVDATVGGDLTALGSDVTVAPGASVGGDALLMGSTVTLGGTVEGALTVTATRLVILPGARITGDVFACADTLTDNRAVPVAPRTCGEAPISPALDAVIAFARGGVGPGAALRLTAFGVIGSLLLSLVLCGLATLAVTVFPRQISHIEEAVRKTPGNLFLSGLTALLFLIGIGSGFVVLLALVPPLGILLLPLIVIFALVFFGTALAGIITLTLVFGDWLLARRSRGHYPYPPLVSAAVGSVSLILLLHLIALIPYGGLLGLLALGGLTMFGAGAAMSTRLGTRPLHRSYFVQG